jgi:AbrB family looped-hinge helix DNA binding protein
MKTVITSKGQITLPKSLRDRLGLKSGDVLEFDEGLPYIKAVPRFDTDLMRSVAGRGQGKSKVSSGEWLDHMRGRVELP